MRETMDDKEYLKADSMSGSSNYLRPLVLLLQTKTLRLSKGESSPRSHGNQAGKKQVL